MHPKHSDDDDSEGLARPVRTSVDWRGLCEVLSLVVVVGVFAGLWLLGVIVFRKLWGQAETHDDTIGINVCAFGGAIVVETMLILVACCFAWGRRRMSILWYHVRRKHDLDSDVAARSGNDLSVNSVKAMVPALASLVALGVVSLLKDRLLESVRFALEQCGLVEPTLGTLTHILSAGVAVGSLLVPYLVCWRLLRPTDEDESD